MNIDSSLLPSPLTKTTRDECGRYKYVVSIKSKHKRVMVELIMISKKRVINK